MLDVIQQKARKYVIKILSLPFLSKKTIFLADFVFVAAIFTISTFVCYNLAGKEVIIKVFITELILCMLLNGTFFYVFSTHKGILRYSSFRDSIRIFYALLCSNIILFLFNLYNYGYLPVILVTIFINFFIGFTTIVFNRMLIRLFFDYVRTIKINRKRAPVLIFGTESTHISLARMIRDNEYLPYEVGGFISSDSRKTNQKIMNYPIYSKAEFLTHPTLFREINALLIVPEELSHDEKHLLVEKCIEYKIELLSSPSPDDWRTNRKQVYKIDKIHIEDLLGRGQITIDTDIIGRDLKDKTILITGAAGSIGSEIVRQLCNFDIKMLLLCDMAETPLHQLSLELTDCYPAVETQLLIADVRDYEKMKLIFEKYRPQFVYHAAAYKHVPLMESQPSEAILANVLGTKNVADLAVACDSECFIMISTDKAVNPSSVMGASKRIAEIYIQCLVHQQNKKTKGLHTRFITTRFGNVLGSNGSVIPRFAKQIETGGPITVTDPEIIRYFMTIPEACILVLEASILGKGGEIFVFDMGESVKIKDLAESMILLSGLEPYKDIDIVFTGLRPGEKLFEEVGYGEEEKLPTSHEKIMISKHTDCDYKKVSPLISRLIEISASDDYMEIVKLMKKIVPEFISLNSEYSVLDRKKLKNV